MSTRVYLRWCPVHRNIADRGDSPWLTVSDDSQVVPPSSITHIARPSAETIRAVWNTDYPKHAAMSCDESTLCLSLQPNAWYYINNHPIIYVAHEEAVPLESTESEVVEVEEDAAFDPPSCWEVTMGLVVVDVVPPNATVDWWWLKDRVYDLCSVKLGRSEEELQQKLVPIHIASCEELHHHLQWVVDEGYVYEYEGRFWTS